MTQDRFGPIAYLTGEYPRATDTFIQREVAGLRAMGHVVETCSIRRTGPEHLTGPEQKAEAKSTFYVLAAAKRPIALIKAHVSALRRSPKRYFSALRLALTTGQPGPRGALYQLFYFAEAAVLTEHLHQSGVRWLHNHIAKSSCSVAMITSEMSGIPFSFTLHGPDIFFAPEQWRLDAKIAKAGFVATISHFARSQAMAFSRAEDWSKLHIVHCGVEPERYAAPAEKLNKNIVFVGRLAGVKGVPVLIDAMQTVLADHPDATLTLVGDGPERGDIETYVAKAGLTDRVTFAGYLSQDEVSTELAKAALFVLPSFAEGVPVVLMEAMAAGVPVITTRIAGIPELVEHGVTGQLVAPGDSTALAQAMTGVLDGSNSTQTDAARSKVSQDYNSRTEAARLANLFSSYGAGSTVADIRPSPVEDAG